MEKVKPLKKFGQNYLTDKNILNKIIDEINPLPEENIVEIGPGTGALTSKLFEKVPMVTAVEIDTRVVEQLSAQFPRLKLFREDFLKMDLQKICNSSKIRIAGNIPYNLTSPILFKLFENNKIVEDAVLMVQFEVAQRMTAKKGTKDYGILTVLLAYFCITKFCFKVSPNVFYPKPKVYSAVVHLFFNKLDNSVDEKLFINIVKASFGNRRKTLKNSLRNSIFADVDFSGSGIDLSLRAEQLDVKDFITLANYVSALSGQSNS